MDKNIARILDANFNRSREAMRVMEDYGRFVLNDAQLRITLGDLQPGQWRDLAPTELGQLHRSLNYSP